MAKISSLIESLAGDSGLMRWYSVMEGFERTYCKGVWGIFLLVLSFWRGE